MQKTKQNTKIIWLLHKFNSFLLQKKNNVFSVQILLLQSDALDTNAWLLLMFSALLRILKKLERNISVSINDQDFSG